jgi:hypothetical protein
MKLNKRSPIYALLKTMRAQPTISVEDLLLRHPKITKQGLKQIVHDYIVTHDGKRWLLLPSLRDQMDIIDGRVNDDSKACIVPASSIDLIKRPAMTCGISAVLEREKYRLKVGSKPEGGK